MKKILLLPSVLGLSIFLAACGSSDDLAGDTNSNETSTEETATETEETTENQEAASEEAAQANLEITKQTGGAWKDSIDTVWVHSSAVFTNTGNVPVEIGETQMNFKGADGGILGTAPMVYSVPSIVAPGETAFVSETTMLDTVTDPSLYAETTYNFDFSEADADANANLLETSGVKGFVGDEYTPYKVTGVVTNTTEEKQDDIRLAAALYAEDGSLLGILTGSVDVGVNPGSEAGFELSYPEIPKGTASKVKTIEVKAYGWTF